MIDPFETAAIRTRVLDAWVASPVRFREDANLEEDLVLGGYRDRVLVELAQNAADAAQRAGVRGRLRLTLAGETLTAANTGAPLDAGGVTGLSTLRASGKIGEAGAGAAPVGRFGVGFAAVLAVSDAPEVLSREGGVRFSAAEARQAITDAAERRPELAAELERREGRVPVLRLPFPADGAVPHGFDTAVVLPLRDGAARELVRGLLTGLDDALLLALPSLTEIVVDVDGDVRSLTALREGRGVCRITDGTQATWWRTAAASGTIPAELLTDRPVEERARPWWSLTWAVPTDTADEPRRPATAPVFHGPTPTDEPMGLPALLIATLPMDPTRRRLAPGALTDFLLDRAAEAYAELVGRWPAKTPGLLRLVPGPIADGPVDAELRRRIVSALSRTAFLPAAAGADDAAGTASTGGAASPDGVAGSAGTADAAGSASPAGGAGSADTADAGDAASPAGVAGSGDPADAGDPTSLSSGADASAPFADLPWPDLTDPSTTPTAPSTTPASAPAGPGLITPRGAAVLVPATDTLVAALENVLPGLLPAGFERDQAALTTLGVRTVSLAEAVEALAGLERAPSWWAALYSALDTVSGHDPMAFDALAALPVPLADGRTVRGPRGTLRPVAGLDAAALAALTPLGLRIVHPDAVDLAGSGGRLLDRLGAQPAEPRAMLADPAVAEAVDSAHDPAADTDLTDPLEVASAVLTLVRAADPRPGERFGLGRLLLPEAGGGLAPAAELLLPGSALAEVVEPDLYGFVDEEWIGRWGAEVLHAAGVPDAFPLLRDTDVMLDLDLLDDDLADLDGFEDWVEHVLGLCPPDAAPVVLAELAAVVGLDGVLPEAWPRALDLLARTPSSRRAVVRPARLTLADGGTLTVPSPTAWWLGQTPVLAGQCPADLLAGDETALTGLYDRLAPVAAGPLAADAEFLTALGVKTTAQALLAAPGGPDELLDRLAEPERPVTRTQLTDLYCMLAELTADQVSPPDRLRATLDGALVVADAEDVVVVDAPDLLPLLAGRPYLPIPLRHAMALAELLDLDLASDVIDADVVDAGEEREVPEAVAALLADAPDSYVEHDDLVLADGTEVDWRVVDGVVHTSTFDGLARGLAWAAGRWDQRHLVAAMLAEPERTADLLVEVDFE